MSEVRNNSSDTSQSLFVDKVFYKTPETVDFKNHVEVETEPVNMKFEPASGIQIGVDALTKDMFTHLCPEGEAISKDPGSWRTLVRIYYYLQRLEKGLATEETDPLRKGLDYVLYNIDSARGVRNRLRYVIDFLIAEFNKLDHTKTTGETIKFTSLASGPGLAILEAMLKLDTTDRAVDVTLTDLADDALAYAKEFIARTELLQKDNIEAKTEKINLFRLMADHPKHVDYVKKTGIDEADVIEMVGFTDYVDDERFVDLLARIFQYAKIGSVLITANITSEHDKEFLEKVMNWQMMYRQPDQIRQLIEVGIKKAKQNIHDAWQRGESKKSVELGALLDFDIDFSLEFEGEMPDAKYGFGQDDNSKDLRQTKIFTMAICRKVKSHDSSQQS